MNKEIVPVTTPDTHTVYALFEQAIAFIKQNNFIGWSVYDRDGIANDIENNRVYKVINGNDLLGIFTIFNSDPMIWGDNEKGDAVYLHRIVLNQAFKGEKLFSFILDWTKKYTERHNLRYIRMDTWAANERLIAYYGKYGFTLVEHFHSGNTEALPLQHRNLDLALLQLDTLPVTGQGA